MKLFLKLVLMVMIIVIPMFNIVTAAEANLCSGAKIETSSIYNETYAGGMAIDGDLETRWNNVGGNVENPAWFIVDLGSEKVINKAVIYDFAARVASFTLEISTDKTNWTIIHTGERLAPVGTPQADKIPCDIDFTAVEARYVRFEASYDAGTSMSIWEFELYNIGNVTLTKEASPVIPNTTASAALVSLTKTGNDETATNIMVLSIMLITAMGLTAYRLYKWGR